MAYAALLKGQEHAGKAASHAAANPQMVLASAPPVMRDALVHPAVSDGDAMRLAKRPRILVHPSQRVPPRSEVQKHSQSPTSHPDSNVHASLASQHSILLPRSTLGVPSARQTSQHHRKSITRASRLLKRTIIQLQGIKDGEHQKAIVKAVRAYLGTDSHDKVERVIVSSK